jgi:DNA-binding MarR family transcriptional regulator
MNSSVKQRSAAREGLLPDQLLALLEAAYRLEGKLEEALTEHGLSLPKLSVLTYLAEARESLALSEIAERLNCVKSNVTQLMDRLEGDGLVRRLYDPADRRIVRAELTAVGRERQTDGAAAVAKIGRELPVIMSPADLAAVARLASALK